MFLFLTFIVLFPFFSWHPRVPSSSIPATIDRILKNWTQRNYDDPTAAAAAGRLLFWKPPAQVPHSLAGLAPSCQVWAGRGLLPCVWGTMRSRAW